MLKICGESPSATENKAIVPFIIIKEYDVYFLTLTWLGKY